MSVRLDPDANGSVEVYDTEMKRWESCTNVHQALRIAERALLNQIAGLKAESISCNRQERRPGAPLELD